MKTWHKPFNSKSKYPIPTTPLICSKKLKSNKRNKKRGRANGGFAPLSALQQNPTPDAGEVSHLYGIFNILQFLLSSDT